MSLIVDVIRCIFLWEGDAIAKNWTLVEEKVISVIKSSTFFLKDYPLLVGYSS